MSAELVLASGTNASPQGTTVGGSKPLHRFTKGQPKIVGIMLLVLGSSFFIISIAIMPDSVESVVILPVLMQGILFIICGILYIVTEHNPTKKTVTISLALSIVTLLGTCWTILHLMPTLAHYHYHHYTAEYVDDSFTESEEASTSQYEVMGVSVEAIFLFYIVVGAIIFIVMSSLAGAALRSTKSQAIIVMTSTATETPVE